MQPKPETFGARLRRIRQERGRDLFDIANRAQISPEYLKHIEGGRVKPPSAVAICDLARALFTDADILFAVSDRLPLDLKREMKSRPLLMLAARVIETWDREKVLSFLAENGMDAEKIALCDVERDTLRDKERMPRREMITRQLKMLIIEKDNFECVYCSAPAILQVDHIYPHSLGGTDEPENLVTCCDKCNRKKFNKTTAPPMVFGRFRAEVEGS